MVDMLTSMSLNEEPEDMEKIAEDNESEETIGDELLPEWARSSTFIGDDFGWYTWSLAMFSTYSNARASTRSS